MARIGLRIRIDACILKVSHQELRFPVVMDAVQLTLDGILFGAVLRTIILKNEGFATAICVEQIEILSRPNGAVANPRFVCPV